VWSHPCVAGSRFSSSAAHSRGAVGAFVLLDGKFKEGWTPINCIYFSVITLTTAGLGDFVPTTDFAKIMCACFIYIGVATIGLLLGSLLVGSMDEAKQKEANGAQIRDCPECERA
jgi:hypothetical protein